MTLQYYSTVQTCILILKYNVFQILVFMSTKLLIVDVMSLHIKM